MRSLIGILACTALIVAWKAPVRSSPLSPCSPADAEAASLLAEIRSWSNSTDPELVEFRAALQLVAVDPADVQLVSDEILCQRAVDSLNASAVRYGGQPLHVRPYLVRFGASHYFAYELPDVPAPGVQTYLELLDGNFNPLRTLVR